MKKIENIGILFLATLLPLSFLSTIGIGASTVGNSTVPVYEGDFYRWNCTYCDPYFDPVLGTGSWINVTIDQIYQGSYLGVPYALIVNATYGQYAKGPDIHFVNDADFYLVYNNTLNYLYLSRYFILPIPVNLTLVHDFIENGGNNCTVLGNDVAIDYGMGRVDTFTYNSNGFAYIMKSTVNSSTFIFSSESEGPDEKIPFGNYYIIPSIICIIVIVIISKKRLFKIYK